MAIVPPILFVISIVALTLIVSLLFNEWHERKEAEELRKNSPKLINMIGGDPAVIKLVMGSLK